MNVSNFISVQCVPAKGNSSPKIVAGAENNNRMKGITIVKPIIYGNMAFCLGKKRENDGHTHQWTIYLRSYDNEDMSSYIRRVQFRLHDSYTEPNRVFTSPPYFVTETGWGEFEVAIKIFFVDNCERPVTLYHFLKLFDREKNGNVKLTSTPVNSEYYDELVFVEPSIRMHTLLSHHRIATPMYNVNKNAYEERKMKDLGQILDAQQKVKDEVSELKQKLSIVKENIAKLKAQVTA